MLYEVPVVPDSDYVEFLNNRSQSLYACHFSLNLSDVHDSRHRLASVPDASVITGLLKQLDIPRKYLLINSRIQEPQHYLDKGLLWPFLVTLEKLLQEGILDGLVFSDFYFLKGLSDASRDVMSQLEAIPGVNCMIDSFDKLIAVHDLIETTHFKPPGKINLDRSLNRKLETLSVVSEQCRTRFPGVKLVLLANEGCLYQCPFKLSHDCLISLSRMGMSLDMHRLNDRLGCMSYLQQHPAKIFKSPFIRPEDVDRYSEWVDVLKLCGRTLGPAFLEKTIEAYLKRSFGGNLLELLDALEWTAQFLNIANQGLPEDFHQQLTACSKDCSSCSYCRLLLDSCSERKELQIRDIRS